MRTVGERLKRIRQERGYTPGEAAALLGISESTVLSYEEAGKLPGKLSLRKISALYGVTEEELLSGETERAWHDGGPLSKLYLLSSVCGYLKADSEALRDEGNTLDAETKEEELSALEKILGELTDLMMLPDEKACYALKLLRDAAEQQNELGRMDLMPCERERAGEILSEAVGKIDRIIYGERKTNGDRRKLK